MTLVKTLRKTYQLKITLKHSKPPIWRRFLIEDSVNLAKLHDAIQIIMGWTDSHLHQYIAGYKFYGVPDPEFGFSETPDERKFRLSQLLKKEKDSVIYEYDFGDGWTHQIMLEKILPFDSDVALPLCIKAKGACPPEDIGGMWGYYHFLNALNTPDHPEHKECTEWFEGGFDPDVYDINAVNELLAKYCR